MKEQLLNLIGENAVAGKYLNGGVEIVVSGELTHIAEDRFQISPTTTSIALRFNVSDVTRIVNGNEIYFN